MMAMIIVTVTKHNAAQICPLEEKKNRVHRFILVSHPLSTMTPSLG